MSTVSTRLSLIHRCTIERDANGGAGAWGEAASPDWQPVAADVACRAWTTSGKELAEDETLIDVQNMRMLLPADTDVTERDRVGDVTYRGATFIAGPLGIRSVMRYSSFVELVLVRIG